MRRFLILEDNPDDALLVKRELKQSGFTFECRQESTFEGFKQALEEFEPELILADRSMPGFDGLDALHHLKQNALDIPFLFVTGSMGEEDAVETLKLGAADYILKDRPRRLGMAVRRAMREAEEARIRRTMEEDLKKRVKEVEELNELLRKNRAELMVYHDLLTHDISNFSMALLSLVDRLSVSGNGSLTDLQKDLLKRANRQGLQVHRLAENARLLLRLRQQNLPAASPPADVSGAVQRAVDAVQAVHFDRDFKVRVEHEELSGRVRVPFLENLVFNLLDNAVRHGQLSDGEEVLVRLGRDGEMIRIAISGGRPPAPAVLETLFRERENARQDGHGLGLTVVREIVTRAGGAIETGLVTEQNRESLEVVLSLPGKA